MFKNYIDAQQSGQEPKPIDPKKDDDTGKPAEKK